MRLALRLVAVLALCGGLAAGAWLWVEHTLTTPGPDPGGPALVSIEPGLPFSRVIERLEGAGVLRHGQVLRAYARWYGLDRSIRAGDYRFERPYAPVELLEALRTGQLALHRVTVPEGKTLTQVARLFAERGFGGVDEYTCLAGDAAFLATLGVPASGLEGYLFPDTYSLPHTATPEEIVGAMVQRFRETAAPLAAARRQRGMSEAEMVTLASIIERETGIASERRQVAAVFHNRLRIGMRLQSDPTAIYPWKEGVPTAADLRVDTPYNTYLYAGLPPGPICNPGQAALEAAIRPSVDDALYFVARGDGSHAFARTLTEHNRNVAALRRKRNR